MPSWRQILRMVLCVIYQGNETADMHFTCPHIGTAQYGKLMNFLNVFADQVAAKAANKGAKKGKEE